MDIPATFGFAGSAALCVNPVDTVYRVNVAVNTALYHGIALDRQDLTAVHGKAVHTSV